MPSGNTVDPITMKKWRELCAERPLSLILALGIVLRVVAFVFLSPFNPDPHFPLVEYIHQHHSIPPTSSMAIAFHPPLYYLMAAPLLSFGGAKTVQILSLLLSVATLLVIHRYLERPDARGSIAAKCHCLLLAALLPEFVMFGLCVSNDCLAFFLGASICFRMFSYIGNPTRRAECLLAVLLGLGLLAKGTFLGFVPALLLLVGFVNLRGGQASGRILGRLAVFSAIFVALGCYKFVDNQIREGKPVIHGLDYKPWWAELQKPTYTGVASVIDINVAKLAMHPMVSDETRHSYPLLLYATFWYQYVSENNFSGNKSGYGWVGSLIYIVALVPTGLMLVGGWRALAGARSLLRAGTLADPGYRQALWEASCLLLLVTHFSLVILLGVKYDVWSCFQSRLVFGAFVPFLVLMGSGLAQFEHREWGAVLYWPLRILAGLFVLYFAIEVALQFAVGIARFHRI